MKKTFAAIVSICVLIVHCLQAWAAQGLEVLPVDGGAFTIYNPATRKAILDVEPHGKSVKSRYVIEPGETIRAGYVHGPGGYTLKEFCARSDGDIFDEVRCWDVAVQNFDLAKLLTSGMWYMQPVDAPIELIGDTRTDADELFMWVYFNFSYDVEKSEAVSARPNNYYTTNVLDVLERKTGICTDFAAVLTALLRGSGIPARYVTGVHPTGGHAWVEAQIDERWRLYDPTIGYSVWVDNAKNYRAHNVL